MKFKIDENSPAEIAFQLAEAGHDAETVVTEGITGAADSDLLEAARREGRVLLTLDKEIANVQRYSPTAFLGIVLFRPDSMGRGRGSPLCPPPPGGVGIELRGRLVVVTRRGIRLR